MGEPEARHHLKRERREFSTWIHSRPFAQATRHDAVHLEILPPQRSSLRRDRPVLHPECRSPAGWDRRFAKMMGPPRGCQRRRRGDRGPVGGSPSRRWPRRSLPRRLLARERAAVGRRRSAARARLGERRPVDRRCRACRRAGRLDLENLVYDFEGNDPVFADVTFPFFAPDRLRTGLRAIDGHALPRTHRSTAKDERLSALLAHPPGAFWSAATDHQNAESGAVRAAPIASTHNPRTTLRVLAD